MAALPNLRRGIGNRVTTSLSASVTDSALTMTVSDATGMNADGGYIMIDEEYSSKREIVYVESITSNTLTISTSGRGLAGTTAYAHDSGATVTDIVVDENVNGIIDTFLVGHSDAGAHSANSIATTAIQDDAVTTAKILDANVTSAKLAEAFVRGRYQADTTNSAPTGMTVQMGWGYVAGNDTAAVSETITFPAAFSAAPIVFVTFISGRPTADGTPTGPAWFTTSITNVTHTWVEDTTTTNFLLRMSIATTFGAAFNFGYNWLAIGTVA